MNVLDKIDTVKKKQKKTTFFNSFICIFGKGHLGFK